MIGVRGTLRAEIFSLSKALKDEPSVVIREQIKKSIKEYEKAIKILEKYFNKNLRVEDEDNIS